MITARNYAAQAMRALDDGIAGIIRTGRANPWSYQNLRNLLDQAVHFAVPDGGIVFGDGLRGILGSKVVMPFDVITVACHFKVASATSKCLLVARDGQDCIEIYAMMANEGSNQQWFPHNGIIILSNSSDLPPVTLKNGEPTLHGEHYIFSEDIYRYEIAQYGEQRTQENHTSATAIHGEVFLELMEALSCRNVSHEPLEEINHRTNARRIKNGKLPLLETRILTIKADPPQKKSNNHPPAADRSGPRQHLRRGHVRRLPSGNIWVRSCVVGDAERGRIEKIYHVAGR